MSSSGSHSAENDDHADVFTPSVERQPKQDNDDENDVKGGLVMC